MSQRSEPDTIPSPHSACELDEGFALREASPAFDGFALFEGPASLEGLAVLEAPASRDSGALPEAPALFDDFAPPDPLAGIEDARRSEALCDLSFDASVRSEASGPSSNAPASFVEAPSETRSEGDFAAVQPRIEHTNR
jgi:hypothetical protein